MTTGLFQDDRLPSLAPEPPRIYLGDRETEISDLNPGTIYSLRVVDSDGMTIENLGRAYPVGIGHNIAASREYVQGNGYRFVVEPHQENPRQMKFDYERSGSA